jgi:membrane protease YdiL (CAAX protease family)
VSAANELASLVPQRNCSEYHGTAILGIVMTIHLRGVLAGGPRKKLLLIAFVASTFTAVLLPKSVYLVVLLCQLPLLLFFFLRDKSLFRETWFWSLFLVSQIWLPWPLSFILPVIVFMIWLLISERRNEVFSWISIGIVDFRSSLFAGVLVLGTSGSLLAWYLLASPDVSDLRRMVPTESLVTILLVGLAFSIFNALWEEITFKGILWGSMTELGFRVPTIIVFQGLLFGFVHLNGFPRGWVGAGLAAVYGMCVGILKSRTKTLGIPVLVHFFADATIFVILAMNVAK